METNFIRSNSRIVINRIRKSIAEDFLAHNDDTNAPFTPTEVLASFNRWYGEYERKIYPNRENAFVNWMQALPTELNHPFADYEIEELLKVWLEGVKPPSTGRNPYSTSAMWHKMGSLTYRELRRMAESDAKRARMEAKQ